MNCRKHIVVRDIGPALQAEINRVREIWHTCREKYGTDGPFLFGSFSIADAMFAPVVMRFRSYGIKVAAEEQRYMDAVVSLETLQEWIADAEKEEEVLSDYEIDS